MTNRTLSRTLLYLAVVLIALWTLLPYAWLVISSISHKSELLTVPLRWLPTNPTLENYQKLFFGGGATGESVTLFLRSLKNSAIIAFLATSICVMVGAFCAYALTRLVFPGHRYAMLFLMATQLLPPVAIVIPGYIILKRLHLLDTFQGVVLVYLSFILPLVVWILRGYFSNIPSELEDAARIDGCTRVGALFRVVLPLSGPGLVSTSVFAFIAAWNEFFYAFIYTSADAKTLPVLIGEFSSKFGPDYISMAAAGVVASIPPLLLALLFQKFLIRGLTAGSVKG
ncbi:MAG: carbohydrate ABC transporter permease [Anaerolineae bacterium]